LTNPSVAVGGALDSGEIGPYTRWHGDLDARLMVVGKDFAGRPGVEVETNRRLARYLRLAGFGPGPVSESHHRDGLFFTNAVLCLPGGDSMRTSVRPTELNTCASRFLKATIELVAPQAIATLGRQATEAVLHASDMRESLGYADLVANVDGLTLPCGSILFAMPHPVASRRRAEQEAAWQRVRTWFERG
jgi:DNA polymerase